jgi:putative FmdB family regulatory protein
MPIFEFLCDQCGHEFEFLALSGNDVPNECPKCQKNTLTKLMSAGSIRAHGIPSGSGGFTAPSCKPSGG